MTFDSVEQKPITFVLTDDGRELTVNDLPPPGLNRWIMRRKADLVQAVRGGLISEEEALVRYAITAEEFAEWTRMIDRYGPQGLRATRLRHYRMREQTPNEVQKSEKRRPH